MKISAWRSAPSLGRGIARISFSIRNTRSRRHLPDRAPARSRARAEKQARRDRECAEEHRIRTAAPDAGPYRTSPECRYYAERFDHARQVELVKRIEAEAATLRDSPDNCRARRIQLLRDAQTIGDLGLRGRALRSIPACI